MKNTTIAIIDLKSFYASCECAARNLDPFKTPLACVDPYRGESTVVMSVTPYLKANYKIPNVCRRRDLPNIKGLILAQPRMSYYLTMNAQIMSIYLNYFACEDIYPYSIDESFINLTPYLSLYNKSAEQIVEELQKEIMDKLTLTATAGIGPNMFLAKMALDVEGKKKPPYLCTWTQEDVKNKLWKIESLTDMWGINVNLEKRLSKIGIRSVKELANADEESLNRELGVIGLELKMLANGQDDSDIQHPYVPESKSLSDGQTLTRDYSDKEGRLLLLEMNDNLNKRLRKENQLTKKIAIGLVYNDFTGNRIERTLPMPTDDIDYLYKHLLELYNQLAKGKKIRKIFIDYRCLVKSSYQQLSIGLDADSYDKNSNLMKTIDEIQDTYGNNFVLRCSSLLAHSTVRRKNEEIGGHRK